MAVSMLNMAVSVLGMAVNILGMAMSMLDCEYARQMFSIVQCFQN